MRSFQNAKIKDFVQTTNFYSLHFFFPLILWKVAAFFACERKKPYLCLRNCRHGLLSGCRNDSKQMKDNANELLPIVDEVGNILDAATRGECHNGSKRLHPVVHLHVLNEQGDIFLQKRPHWKDVQPGRWDTAVGGHVDFGEGVEQALRREAREELGLDIRGWVDGTDEAREGKVCQLCQYVFESSVERELVFVHVTTQSEGICPSEETDGGRFWTRADIEAARGQGVLTPNFEQEYDRIAPLLPAPNPSEA